ncbi:MAG: aspartyl-phosphate phosphatase Spo0E family protein [Sporolactobacillus sp.]|jgi:hypothetical protein|nr:aspartyl-phosphate phosphatase Spo0E family protein [Sporolactobacillus sp.]
MPSFPADKQAQNIIFIHSEKIEAKRKQLFDTAKQYGIYADETLRCSQELDHMIVEIQSRSLPLS